MAHSLQKILQFEDNNQFEKALEAYKEIHLKYKGDYKIWSHFYFFLWISIEDAPSEFHNKINLRHLLQTMLDEGKEHFANQADFNFIAGYTISIFPYEYGEYADLEKEGQTMLLKAMQLDSDNLIYRMVYLGSLTNIDKQEYRKAEIEAAPKVLETFGVNGFMNKYFRQVLYRPGYKDYH